MKQIKYSPEARQDFMQILFGIQTQSDEVEDYWND